MDGSSRHGGHGGHIGPCPPLGETGISKQVMCTRSWTALQQVMSTRSWTAGYEVTPTRSWTARRAMAASVGREGVSDVLAFFSHGHETEMFMTQF